MIRFKKFLIIIPIVLGIIIFIVLKQTKNDPIRPGNKERVSTVRVISLEKMDVVPRAIGYGYVEAERTWEAIPEVSGKIVFMNKNLKRGHFISKGELLLKIDTTTYGLAEKKGQAELMSVEAQLKELDQAKKNTQRLLAIEKKSLNSEALELKRKRELFEKGYLSASNLDKEERTFLSHQTTVNNLQNTLDLIPSQKKALQAQRASGQSSVSERQLDVAKTEIYAPFNCRLSSVNVELDQFASSGTILLAAESFDRVEIPVQITPDSFMKLMPRTKNNFFPDSVDIETLRKAIGITAKVKLPIDGRFIEWDGWFSRTSESIDLKTGAITVYIAVDKPYENVLPGIRPPLVTNMYVEVELQGRPLSDRFVVPRHAVHDRTIYVCSPDNQLEIRPVEIEFLMGDLAVLTKGVEPGERLVLSDMVPAIDGMRLKPVDDVESAKKLQQMAKSKEK